MDNLISDDAECESDALDEPDISYSDTSSIGSFLGDNFSDGDNEDVEDENNLLFCYTLKDNYQAMVIA